MNRSIFFAVLLLAFVALASATTSTSGGSPAEQIANALPANYGQLKAQVAALQANLTAQIAAVQSSLAAVAANVKYIKSLEQLGNLPEASTCTTLDCVRTPINQLDELIMQLYATRLSFAVQAGFIKYQAGQDVLDPSRESVVLANAAANAVANGLPSYVGSVLYGNYCMLYVSKRLEVEVLNEAYNAGLPMPVQHAD
ncbi:chorismate mutase subfamily protein [Acanthamoeba castellanii str. Neff]|jgi:chorismate mutase|uniref:Chorismate mutase subfamily protein n=1 Tax=Acanthamoeba castellanii (strain ATCC 30010 / Neff) TaxID=1257118 RepID=L8GTD0_ACACF|nr:chorismate mutase subfamily protein [Acanthamoeba castellanii str. Neff]ELR15868.1 chorismate mutase subfamily protein [Acanthamoeba castellanii str. Neff]